MNPGRIRILLVMPDGRIHKLKLGPINTSFREAPLTVTMLAALVPEDVPADLTCIDESVQKVPFHENFDIVGVSCMTGTSTRGYEIARRFRERGSTVILGGIHVTLRPEEARKHADTIVTGFAERAWPRLLHDYMNGCLKPKYSGDASDIHTMPTPLRRLQKKMGYMVPNTVFATRGCRGSCDFCSVPAAGYGWHKRSIDDVIREISSIKTSFIAFSDVHLTEDPDHAKELFRRMVPLKKKWGSLASTRVLHDPELLDLMEASGCSYLLIGFESFNRKALNSINKGFNKVSEYRKLVTELHKRNIIIQGCFIFGFDDDTTDCFEETVDLVNDLKIDIPRYAVFTPYPGTGAFDRLYRENRLLHFNWEYYDTQHVVFEPKLMNPQQLNDGFKWAYKTSFKLSSNLERTMLSGKNFPITFLGNLAYKLYVRRLYREQHRFPSSDNIKTMEET